MISRLVRKIFGSRNDRLIKQYAQTVRVINALEPTIAKLWSMAKGVPYYFIGFLEFMPDNLPDDQPARADYAEAETCLKTLAGRGNAYAERFLSLLSANGQTYLKAVSEVLGRPSTSLVVYALLDTIGNYFHALEKSRDSETLEEIFANAAAAARGEPGVPGDLQSVITTVPHHREGIAAMLALSGLSNKTADPWLLRNTAVGALMRRKIEPLVAPISHAVQTLRTPAKSQ